MGSNEATRNNATRTGRKPESFRPPPQNPTSQTLGSAIGHLGKQPLVSAPAREPGRSRLAIHAILDNYATHKHTAVRRWLARHPRVHFHFTPTSASWLNLVERFFAELTERQLRRLAVTSVAELIAAIPAYIEQRNAEPHPFVWTASVRSILAKVNKANETLATLH